MVMNTVLNRNLLRSIRRSLTRYIAIVAIIALGTGIFVGLRTTKSDMIATGQRYMDAQNMFDLRLLNTYGWSDEQVTSIQALPGVENAEGVIMVDAIARPEGEGHSDDVYKFYAIPQQVDKVRLQGGRMPENPGECLMDGFHFDESLLGTTITVSERNEEATYDGFTQHTFTIVGYVSSPLYMDMTRGSTNLGNGSVKAFIYLPRESFLTDTYSEIALTIPGSHRVYSKAYDEAVDRAAQSLEPELMALVQQRGEQLMQQAMHSGEMPQGAAVAPTLFMLDRNTNAGYLALDNNSDIVKGVSTVFPAFFLLIAALVCITTMTRMVEEERTEIGTLKALGYSNWEIVSKYLRYSGSAAILGCGLGVILGSVIFPVILWRAYGILFNITPKVVLQIDWLLCGAVVFAYTTVNLLVTWYCCRRMLSNVPAQLIRPKAPTSGKKVFLEYLPLWNRLSFLNKVMLRNVFRYKQRFFMMMVGIGGCTALLLTGFGMRDSIVDLVDYQFEEITIYDMEVRFGQPCTPEQMDTFRQELGGHAQNTYFYHQSNVKLSDGNSERAITLICADDGLENFMDFHRNGKPLSMPGKGEALVSVGMAEMMGISVGEQVSIKNADMQTMDVTVSGVYENYVHNYIIVSEDTYQDQLGIEPSMNVACVNVAQGADVNNAGMIASQADGVISVMISQELADQIGKMMEALNMVVATIVVCAMALAGIVLYNLTNINITERIREIATIKVLGFRAGETAAYVFKENLLLSLLGAGIGLWGGKLLLRFVVSQIKVDIVWLLARANLPSFLLSIAITMLCACLVDLILYFRLEKINMAEALKSVE